MNKIIVACAGSGKTTYLVNSAMNLHGNVLITTFTDSNSEEIKKKFFEIYGYKNPNIFVLPWFTFLLTHLIRPFQLSIINEKISNICMVQGKSAIYKNQNTKEFYVKGGEIYSDKIACLAFKTLCKDNNTINRLKRCFDYIFIDEFQDFAGYDLEIVDYLAKNGFSLKIVCDPRQHTFSTHYDSKNVKYAAEPLEYIKNCCKDYFEIDYNLLNDSYRCPQNTIRYASKIFPEFPQSNSRKPYIEGDGIYFIKNNEVETFISNEKDVIQLRNNKKVIVDDRYPVTTFGKSKGLTVENVIIYPTKEMLKAICLNDFSKFKSKSDLYVALTRAKHKTAIIVPEKDFDKFEKILEFINSFLK